jgi:hypothetical protein
MQQILLEEQQCFPGFIGNSLGRPASSGVLVMAFFHNFKCLQLW